MDFTLLSARFFFFFCIKYFGAFLWDAIKVQFSSFKAYLINIFGAHVAFFPALEFHCACASDHYSAEDSKGTCLLISSAF